MVTMTGPARVTRKVVTFDPVPLIDLMSVAMTGSELWSARDCPFSVAEDADVLAAQTTPTEARSASAILKGRIV
jgi:hypothetical protein